MATTPGNRLCKQLGELFERHGAHIDAFAGASSNGSCFDFPIPDNQEIGCLEQSMLADFKADLFVSQVTLGTEPALDQRFSTSMANAACLSVIFMITAWVSVPTTQECAGVVLDEHADEPLERPEDRTVQHHRTLTAVVLRHVAGIETLGQIRIVLQRTALPVATQAIAQSELDLRPIEGSSPG